MLRLLKLADDVAELRQGVPMMPEGSEYRAVMAEALQPILELNHTTLEDLLALLNGAKVAE